MLEPLISRIEVPCSQQRAFDIFIREMGSWWPLHKRSMSLRSGHPPKGLNVDPQLGGKIVELGHDNTEHHWGTIKTFSPHDLIAMDFHMGMPADKASLVEVRFASLGENRTEVELTQSNWEGFGDMAEMLRSHYGPGWVIIFEGAYHDACMSR
jgi:Activator of Hsp90 ATPase homolog 1-like protein